MRHPERHQAGTPANTNKFHVVPLLNRPESDELIETESDDDLYVDELSRRIAVHASEDEQSVAAFDWIN